MKKKGCKDMQQAIRKYLVAVEKDPNIKVAAYYDVNGDYVIKKLVEKKDNIFTKLNPFKNKKNTDYKPYAPTKVEKSDFRSGIEVRNSGYECTKTTYNASSVRNQIIFREESDGR